MVATAVFEDPHRLEEDATQPGQGETRIKTIGVMGCLVVVTVVSTDRKNRIRIISARRASKEERTRYEMYRPDPTT